MDAKRTQSLGEWHRSPANTSLPPSYEPLWTNNRNCVDLTDQIVALIESATKTLWIASPFIDDRRITDALVRAKSRRVRIKLITDIRNNRGRGKLFITRGFRAQSVETAKLDNHQSCIRELTRSLISCRSPTHYPHLKLLVADNRQALLSSANLTKNSLGGDAASSIEAGILIYDVKQVDQLTGLLLALWKSCPYQLILNEADVSIEQQGSGECISPKAKTALELGWLINSPGEKFFSLTDAIVDAVRNSKRELLVATMSIFETSKVPRLEEALLAALSRGVKITAIVRQEHFRRAEEKGEYPDSSTKKLLQAGMELHGIKGLHFKGLLADQAEGLIFSANINPYSLTSELESNHLELGKRLVPTDANFDAFCNFLNGLRDAASYHYVLHEQDK